jgi:hypothetical protein
VSVGVPLGFCGTFVGVKDGVLLLFSSVLRGHISTGLVFSRGLFEDITTLPTYIWSFA